MGQDEKLLPCPFCGYAVFADHDEETSADAEAIVCVFDGEDDSHYFECPRCETQGPKADCTEDAAEGWNTRTAQSAGDVEAVAWRYEKKYSGSDGYVLIVSPDHPDTVTNTAGDKIRNIHALYARPATMPDVVEAAARIAERNQKYEASDFPVCRQIASEIRALSQPTDAQDSDALLGRVKEASQALLDYCDFEIVQFEAWGEGEVPKSATVNYERAKAIRDATLTGDRT